ncbi:hypothetical protein LQ318_02220 [Aliifodinibius salicampi]|uniref:Tetratricopeptide repeat-containing protein n=1 Tax=Fodinibius salicampi TaxID=1920655 RepID=A0ABT3PV43_9BACT|nr:hypothetical protein [Fodinibius salicampi]MCW9711708.1 hypothetical protein [Fodinibius salicampi]
MMLLSCEYEQQNSQEDEQLVPLIPEALNAMSFSISTDDSIAQAYFDQGLQLGYAFGRGDARRSFIEAQQLDSTCAMCYWGEAWARGPYLNNQWYVQPGAYDAVKKAMELAEAGHTNAMEKSLITALDTRYNKEDDLTNRAQLDTAYVQAMEKVYQEFPGHPEITTLYAEALFILEPRRGERSLADPDVKRIVEVLEEAMKETGMHPGLCHFYIHVLEASDQPERALSCAEYIGDSIPGASHINHMPSHIWNQVGEWEKSVSANINAWHTDLKADRGEAFEIYEGHNLHMLAFTAAMDGQGAISIQAAKDLAKITGSNVQHLLALIRFGRFEEVLELVSRPDGETEGGIWEFAQGYAQLKTGNKDTAQDYLESLKSIANNSEDNYNRHPAQKLLGVLGYILEGEIFRKDKSYIKAVKAFEEAVTIYDQFEYSEPEPLPFSPRHWLGSVLIDMGDYSKAEEVYRRQLEHHPNNGWSLFGLKEALKRQGKPEEEVENDFLESWKRSEVWIESAQF